MGIVFRPMTSAQIRERNRALEDARARISANDGDAFWQARAWMLVGADVARTLFESGYVVARFDEVSDAAIAGITDMSVERRKRKRRKQRRQP